MNTPAKVATAFYPKEPAYKLPIMPAIEQDHSISNAEAKLHAIIKSNAAKFIAGENPKPLQYEIKMLLKYVYDEGYCDGLKKGQQISEL